jgi:hypothetical protein
VGKCEDCRVLIKEWSLGDLGNLIASHAFPLPEVLGSWLSICRAVLPRRCGFTKDVCSNYQQPTASSSPKSAKALLSLP